MQTSCSLKDIVCSVKSMQCHDTTCNTVNGHENLVGTVVPRYSTKTKEWTFSEHYHRIVNYIPHCNPKNLILGLSGAFDDHASFSK